MHNGWLPIRMARHLGAATVESRKAKRVLLWIRGHGHDFGRIYLAAHGRSQKGRAKLIPVAEHCIGKKVVAFQPLPKSPNSRSPTWWNKD